MSNYPSDPDWHEMSRDPAPPDSAYNHLDNARTPWQSSLPLEKSAHLTLKINLPMRLLGDPQAAIDEAKRLAGRVAEEAVWNAIKYGVGE